MIANHKIIEGDLLSILPTLPDNHFDAVLCDPPYHLTSRTQQGQNSRGGSARKGLQSAKGFMGHTWDGGDVAFRPETWEAVMRVMKPGAYFMAFGGSRTFHRLAVAMEDAGFILVDTLMWLYSTGFPKSTNVAAHIDRLCVGSGQRTGPTKSNTYAGAQRDPARHRNPADQSHTGDFGLHSTPHGLPAVALETPEGKQWAGYGTAAKPAYEPILLCRKPGEKTYAANALKWGCGALNIDGARIPVDGETLSGGAGRKLSHIRDGKPDPGVANNGYVPSPIGRWPANVMFDEAAAEILDAETTAASRFFYASKVSTKERQAGMGDQTNDHPTMKPIDLTRQLATLLLPPARLPTASHDDEQRRLLVPFSGSGSEMIGALMTGWDDVTGIEQSAEYAAIARERLIWWLGEKS